MLPPKNSPRRTPTLLLLEALLTGCASAPPLSPVNVAPQAKPQLPPRVRQTPAECSPKCSSGLSKLLDELPSTPIKP